MDKMLNVYTFHCFYEGDIEFKQERYVVAKESCEAWEKFDRYCEEMVKKGFARLIALGEPDVELQNVII